MTAPTIAVIIPYFNGSAFISRSIRSVFSQSVSPTEVIVVNDGSEQTERAALIALQKNYPIRVIDQNNSGQGGARNAGVNSTKCDYVCFLDQDDFFLPDHIEILSTLIKIDDPHFGWGYGTSKIADADGVIQAAVELGVKRDHPKTDLAEMLAADMYILPSASVISRSALQYVGGFDSSLTGYEDDDLFIRLHLAGFSNYFINQPVSVWCIHGASTSYSFKMISSRFRFACKLLENYPQNVNSFASRFARALFIDTMTSQQITSNLHDQRGEIQSMLRQYVASSLKMENMTLRNKLFGLTLYGIATKLPYRITYPVVHLIKNGISTLRRLMRN